MRTNHLVAICLALAMLVAMPAAGIAGASIAQDDDAEENSTDDVAPGERLSGVVGAQQAELDGEVKERSFGLQIANASSDDEAADVVAGQAQEIEQRLDDLDERLEDLEEQREAGEITQGQYAAQAAQIEAERGSLERLANHTGAAAGELPAELLEERGVNAAALDELTQRASELGGEEVREIATSIAGENVGQSAAEERGNHAAGDVPGVGDVTDPDDAGPPGEDRGAADDRQAGDDGAGDAGEDPDADGDADADDEQSDDAGADDGAAADAGDEQPDDDEDDDTSEE